MRTNIFVYIYKYAYAYSMCVCSFILNFYLHEMYIYDLFFLSLSFFFFYLFSFSLPLSYSFCYLHFFISIFHLLPNTCFHPNIVSTKLSNFNKAHNNTCASLNKFFSYYTFQIILLKSNFPKSHS